MRAADSRHSFPEATRHGTLRLPPPGHVRGTPNPANAGVRQPPSESGPALALPGALTVFVALAARDSMASRMVFARAAYSSRNSILALSSGVARHPASLEKAEQ